MVDRLPSEGSVGDLAERLCHYVDRWLPGWSDRIVGATGDDLARLNANSGLTEVGLAYPASFEQTMLLMGRSDGGLLAHMNGRYGRYRSIDDLFSYYNVEEMSRRPDEFNAQLPVIMGSELGINLSFDFRPDHRRPEPAVYVTEAGQFEYDEVVYAESWEQLLLHAAVWECESRHARWSAWTSCSRNELNRALQRLDARDDSSALRAFAADHGLSDAWFNDPTHYCASRTDATIIADVSRYGMLVCVAGDDPSSAQRLADELAELLALRHFRLFESE